MDHVSVNLSISCGGSWRQKQLPKNSKLHSQYRRFQLGAARNLGNISSEVRYSSSVPRMKF